MSDDRSKQVYIGFLPNDARMDDVEEFFKGFGKIRSINLKPGYGFVDFEDIRDAQDAVKVIFPIKCNTSFHFLKLFISYKFYNKSIECLSCILTVAIF